MRSSLTRFHDPPPSSERNSPPSFASISAYTRRLSDGATATPILPHAPSGRPASPALSCFQVSPPSRETYSPLPGPPDVISHGLRRACQRPAKMIRGLFGSRARSLAPVSESLLSTCCQVLPPSVVR